MAASEQLIFDILARDAASASLLKVGQAAASASGSVGDLNRRLTEINGRIAIAKVTLSGDKEAQAALAKLQASLTALGARTSRPNVQLTDAGFAKAAADIAAADVALDNLNKKYDPASLGMTRLGLAAAVAGVSLAGLGKQTKDGATAANTALSTLSYGWGRATGSIKLFGGALSTVPILGSVGAVHLLTDAIVETTAVILPAAVAFTAFGVAAIPTVQSIYAKMQAVYTTSTALGQNIYPMTGAFSALAQAVQPKVYQLFGEALVVMNAKTGEFTKLAVGAGTALDQLGARAAAALTSGGLNAFLKDAVPDMAKIGDIIGNLFGTVGNLLHSMPGYAETLLGVLDGVTKGLEAVTASPITQWLVGVGLAMHGAVLYLGLGATAAVVLGNALVGLAAKFGLAQAGALAFDATEFGAGLSVIGHSVADAAVALVTFSGAEDLAAASSAALDGAFITLGAVNPLVWVGAAAAGLGVLVYWLTRSTSATQGYDDAVNKSLQNAPVSQLGLDLTRQMASTIGNLADAQLQLAHTQEYATEIVNKQGTQEKVVTQAYSQQSAVVAGYKGELLTLQGYQANYNTLLKAAGGNLGFLNDAGITSNQIIGASASQMRQYIIEVQAAAAAQQALGLGVGRSAAAQNAQTNAWLTSGLPAMQKVIQAEDAVLSLVLGAPQAFIGFEQSIQQMGKDAGLTGKQIAALANAGSTSLQDFYNTAVPAAQKLIDALQSQDISTKNLTTAVADEAKAMLPFVTGNIEARSVIVDLINNALGPGTVNLQTLNTWVGKNSGSLGDFNKIVAQSTVQAGILAGVIKNDVVAQFALAKLATDGTTTAINNLAKAEGASHPNAKLIQDDAQTLFDKLVNVDHMSTTAAGDLVRQLDPAFKNTGTAAGNAASGGLAAYLTKLQQLQAIKMVTTNIHEVLSAAGSVNLQTSGVYLQTGVGHLTAYTPYASGTGGAAPGWGFVGEKGPELVHFKGGETVVPNHMLPGYAAGAGVVAPGVPASWLDSHAAAAVGSFGKSAIAAYISGAEAALAPGPSSSGGHVNWTPGANVGQWSSTAAAALKRVGLPQTLLLDVMYQMLTESGGNPYAVNRSDINWVEGHPSVGLMQVIAGTYAAYGAPLMGYPPPVAYGVSENPLANIVAAVNYGAHNGAGFGTGPGQIGSGHGYDSGGFLPPGLSLAWNGTGRPEPVIPAGSVRSRARAGVTGRATLDDVVDALGQLTAVCASQGGDFAGALNGIARSSGYAAMYSTRP